MTMIEDPNLWCHFYAQHSQHSEARIEGTREALAAIRDAIDLALTTGHEGRYSSLYCGDGEGYAVVVNVRSYEYLREQAMPYMAPYAGGIGQSLHENELEIQRKTAELVAKSKLAKVPS